MTVRVDWETGQGSSAGFRVCRQEKYKARIADIDAQKRQHSKTVPLPDYNGQMCAALRCTFYPAMT